MANMSYCRFHNTYEDLVDCIEALESRNIESESEKKKAKMLLSAFLDFCENEGIIQEYDESIIHEIVDECEDQEEE